jgi:ABC-type nitrate/sulfonate/bicarbonate transport system substrate-binding protein
MAMPASEQCLAAFCVLLALGTSEAAAQGNCAAMRRIDIGISVAPPNVVHTSPYVALELGYFAKHCIDARIVQFDGGESPAVRAAAAQGTALVSTNAVEVGRGVGVQQIWGLAPRLPQAYVVAESIKTAADLKGKRLSATGGGIGGLNWLMSREVLKTAGLTANDAQFIPSATAARLPALLAGQIDGVALHPEDVYLAQKEKPGLHVLVQLVDLLPEYMFNAYGAATDWIARDHALMVDTVAAMIEANRTIYRDESRVVPIMMKATGKPKEAVEYAWEVETQHCVWSVNEGFSAKRTQWTIDNAVANGYIDQTKKPTVEQVVNMQIANEAVAAAGGRVIIGGCTE